MSRKRPRKFICKANKGKDGTHREVGAGTPEKRLSTAISGVFMVKTWVGSLA
jgi:hypothetical protein